MPPFLSVDYKSRFLFVHDSANEEFLSGLQLRHEIYVSD